MSRDVRRDANGEDYVLVSSGLFRESGVNSYEDGKIEKFARAMDHSGWGSFPPVHGVLQRVDAADFDDWAEAEEGGYTHELAWSRPLRRSDNGRVIVALEDGHHRAYAAALAEIPIRVKVWRKIR